MPTYSNETELRPGSYKYSKSKPHSGYESRGFADLHAVSKTIRNIQGAIGLTNKESLILKYLITNPDKYIDDRQISMLMFGIFDGNSDPATVQDMICGIRSKYLSEFGVDPIRFDPALGYMVASRRNSRGEAGDAP